MPAVLTTGPTAMQNSPLLPQSWLKPSPVLTAPVHGGMARLSGLDNKYEVLDPSRHQSQC